MSSDITIEKRLLQVLFDVTIGTNDFASGGLDDEDVAALRSVAEVLGVDPMVATPDTFKCQYGHAHNFHPSQGRYCFLYRKNIP